tara:strand:+ start:625 stop:954 length:330 start_codon:yes stop_codon:yes gene_type:complete
MLELFDENNKSLGVSFGGKAKNQRPYRISIDGNNCSVDDQKYKLTTLNDSYMCSLKEKRKNWDLFKTVSIDRYTGVAKIRMRLIAYQNTVNTLTEAAYICKKGKAKKKF